MSIQAPFPYFGGKSTVAAEVWRRFGTVQNYVEPFAGSLAVLLGRPRVEGTETVNDYDGLLTNFWRAVRLYPEETAAYADWPVSECDLHARHLALIARREALTERLSSDPDYCDVEAAAWWVWGACCWIGSGWCSGDGPWTTDGERLVRRDELGDAGQGIHRQLPHLGNAGRGIHRQLPHLGDAGRGDVLRAWFALLSARLERVRIACGDFERVLEPSVTTGHGTTAVFLDPPYPDNSVDYAAGTCAGSVHARAQAWAAEHGNDPALRIALCGYDSFEMPDGWVAHSWKARGGYGSQGDGAGRANAARETIWFSPHCVGARLTLFDQPAEVAA